MNRKTILNQLVPSSKRQLRDAERRLKSWQLWIFVLSAVMIVNNNSSQATPTNHQVDENVGVYPFCEILSIFKPSQKLSSFKMITEGCILWKTMNVFYIATCIMYVRTDENYFSFLLLLHNTDFQQGFS